MTMMPELVVRVEHDMYFFNVASSCIPGFDGVYFSSQLQEIIIDVIDYNLVLKVPPETRYRRLKIPEIPLSPNVQNFIKGKLK